jgi:hypothetical protein
MGCVSFKTYVIVVLSVLFTRTYNISNNNLRVTRGSNSSLAEEQNYLLKLFTIRSKTGGCISAGGGVAATSWLCIVCRQSGRRGSVQAAHTPGGNLIEGAGIHRRNFIACSGQSRWGPEGARESTN